MTYAFLSLSIKKAPPLLVDHQITEATSQKEVLHYVAIGDSLTEGVGDATQSGGFVPLVAKALQEKYHFNGIETDNFGKNGDRSDQILKRIKKDDALQKNLASADVITLTVGGNDLMKVVKGDIFKLTVASFEKPQKNYQKQVEKLLRQIRQVNPQAPIYVLGIYNPFYLYFPEMVEMQDIIDHWNAGTENVVRQYEQVFFIPINSLLYKGTGDQVGITAEGEISRADLETNNTIFEDDHFHPNHLGYQLMAKAVYEEMVRTRSDWLPKESE